MSDVSPQSSASRVLCIHHCSRNPTYVCCTRELRILASLPLPLTVVSAQQCYTTSITCTSTSFNIPSTRPAGPYACCVNGGGRSYKLSPTGPCTACVGKCCLLRVRSLPSASVPPPATVFGFFPNQTSSLPITSISHREGSQLSLYFGYVNGTFSANQLASFAVPDSKFAPPPPPPILVRAPLF